MAANAPKVVGSARANAAHPKRRDLLGCARLRQMNFKHLRGEARYGYPALAMRNSTARWSLCKEGHLEKSLGWESHSYKTLCSIMRALKNLELKGRPRDTAWGRGGSDRTRHGVDDRRQHPGYASHTFPSTASSNIYRYDSSCSWFDQRCYAPGCCYCCYCSFHGKSVGSCRRSESDSSQ